MLTEPAATIGRKWGGMDGLEYQVVLLVNHIGFASGKATPEHVDNVAATCGQRTDGSIGKRLPTHRGMAVGLMGTNGKGGVEQQHTLTRPAGKIA